MHQCTNMEAALQCIGEMCKVQSNAFQCTCKEGEGVGSTGDKFNALLQQSVKYSPMHLQGGGGVGISTQELFFLPRHRMHLLLFQTNCQWCKSSRTMYNESWYQVAPMKTNIRLREWKRHDQIYILLCRRSLVDKYDHLYEQETSCFVKNFWSQRQWLWW